jgi:hypothetical protein
MVFWLIENGEKLRGTVSPATAATPTHFPPAAAPHGDPHFSWSGAAKCG